MKKYLFLILLLAGCSPKVMTYHFKTNLEAKEMKYFIIERNGIPVYEVPVNETGVYDIKLPYKPGFYQIKGYSRIIYVQ